MLSTLRSGKPLEVVGEVAEGATYSTGNSVVVGRWPGLRLNRWRVVALVISLLVFASAFAFFSGEAQAKGGGGGGGGGSSPHGGGHPANGGGSGGSHPANGSGSPGGGGS